MQVGGCSHAVTPPSAPTATAATPTGAVASNVPGLEVRDQKHSGCPCKRNSSQAMVCAVQVGQGDDGGGYLAALVALAVVVAPTSAISLGAVASDVADLAARVAV
jgi:hypothetical protein